MRVTDLPTQFNSLQSKINYIQQWGREEWSASCPQCGGAPHSGDGSLPDRFRMWTNASGKNKVMGWCRKCGYLWFPDSDRPPCPEDLEKWRREQIVREEQRKRDAERAIELLNSERIWEQYHENVSRYTFARDTIRSWGIPDEFADAWKIGFVPDFTVHSKKYGEYYSPAVTIPVWQPGWQVKNVKVRVLNPKDMGDRYRKVYKTGEDGAFWTNPSLESDTCLVVEGEKKAMVCSVWRPENMQVIGLPTKSPSRELLAQFAKFKSIYLCLDPDAQSDLGKLVKTLGKFRTKVLTLPGKIDDMIVNNSLNLREALKYAKRMEVV